MTTPAEDPVTEAALDALRDVLAMVRAHLRGDAEGFRVLLNASTEPRLCTGMIAMLAAELLHTVRFADATPDEVLSDLGHRIAGTVLDAVRAFPPPEGEGRWCPDA